MKKTLLALLLLSAISSAQSYPIKNSYAPTAQDVVVLYDIADREFMPFFFHKILGEFLDMKMHDSCKSIKVTSMSQSTSIICVSAQNKETIIGSLNQAIGQSGYHRAYTIAWNGKARIVQFVNPLNNSISYSVVVNP